MSKKLYVGNLPFSATDSDLLNVFQQQGDVLSARVVVDRETGRSKGFGFVEMSSDDEATTAVTELNGKPFMGRTLTVNEARPREEGGGGGGGRGGGGGGGGGRIGGGGGGGIFAPESRICTKISSLRSIPSSRRARSSTDSVEFFKLSTSEASFALRSRNCSFLPCTRLS